MLWPPVLFNLCVGLILAGYLFRAVRLFERRADALETELERRHAERLAKIDAHYDAEERKYDVARDEIKASMRQQADRMIADLETGLKRASAERQALTNHVPIQPLSQTAADAPTDPPTRTVPH